MTSSVHTVGIFVGGASRRMGTPKGLLTAPDSNCTLVERLAQQAKVATPEARIVLLAGERSQIYAHLGLLMLEDSPASVGPMGGLRALLLSAPPESRVIALACDLPFVTSQLIERLVSEHQHADGYAPRSGGYWQPLFARYDVGATLPLVDEALKQRRHGLTRLLNDLGPGLLEMPISVPEAATLEDWDTPESMRS